MLVSCKYCGKTFNVKPSKIKRGCGKFCSRTCMRASVANEIVEMDDYAKLIVKSPKYGTFESLIDLDDVGKIQKIHWNFEGDYVTSREKGLLHRYISNCPKEKIVDHINRNKLDNRKSNLRICNHSDNLLNASIRITNKTGVVGVFKRQHGWEVSYRGKYVGHFTNFEQAVAKRKECEISYEIVSNLIKRGTK